MHFPIKKWKTTVFNYIPGLVIAAPLTLLASVPTQQQQFQGEITIDYKNHPQQYLRDSLIKIVFEGNENNKNYINNIETQVKHIVQQQLKNKLTEKEIQSIALNLIKSTKDNFQNKELLEEAWYHWFPRAFWWSVYIALEAADFIVKGFGELFQLLPLGLDFLELYLNYLSLNIPAAQAKKGWIIAKILMAMTTNDDSVIVGLSTSVVLDILEKWSNTLSRTALLTSFLKSLVINGPFAYLVPKVKELTQKASSYLEDKKTEAWGKYLYYKKLTDGE